MILLPSALLLIISVSFVFGQDASERFYQSIRNDDLTTLRALMKEYGTGSVDSRGQTPLMLAAAVGSYDATKLLIDGGADVKAVSASRLTALHLCAGDIKKVRLLLDHGADVNARSQMGRTPLVVAAYTNGASETVKLLLSKGADVKTVDATGLTPLIAAAKVNDTKTAKLLVDRGVDIDARANVGQAATALMGASHNGNAELTRLFLGHNASVDLISAPGSGIVRNGIVQFGSMTALHLAALRQNAEAVKLLLEAGAHVDALDMRGMTPLMWSVSTDHPNPAIIHMLLQKGADPAARSKVGETTFDWVRKFNSPEIVDEFKLPAPSKTNSALPVKPANVTPRTAAELSIPLLQSSATQVLNNSGCIACHAAPLTLMAVKLARDRGWTVDQAVAAESAKAVNKGLSNFDQPMLQAEEGGGGVEAGVYSSVALASWEEASSWGTDVLVHYLLAKQRAEGNWHGIGASRAPIQDGDFSPTAMSIRTLAVYGMAGRRTEIDERIERAAKWLTAQTPLTTEDRVMQLLGLKWANAGAPVREKRKRELIMQQRSDGGWSQTPYLSSDAYATGQVLYTLHEFGVPSADPIFQRGVEYLLRTQLDDGSWFTKSRAMKIQPYFESGFPHGHDQWISSAATAWAVMALTFAAPDQATVAAIPPVR